MKDIIKKDIKTLSLMFSGAIIYIIFAIVVPDESIIKEIFAYFMVAILILLIIFFTPIGNPIKKLYKKLKE